MGDQGRQPVGMRFRPTQQELIHLLQSKVGGTDIAGLTESVLEKDLYGKDTEPWRVFLDVENDKWELYDDAGTKRVLYVITKLSKMSAKKISRTARCGTWDGQTQPKPVEDYQGDKIVGFVKLLNYVVDHGYELTAANKGYWYMHEYSLSEHSLKENGVGSTDYVIYRIIKDGSKSCNVKSTNKGGKRVNAREPRLMIDQYATTKSRIFPQEDYGSTTESRMPEQDYDGTTGTSIPQEFSTCYVENQCLALSVVEGLHDQYSTCYVENQCLAPSGVEGFYDYYHAGENQNYYNPNVYTAPTEEMYCGNQQMMGEMLSCGVQQITGSEYCVNQQMMGLDKCAGIEDMYCVNQLMIIGTCLGVEDCNVIEIDEEQNLHPANEGMDSSIASRGNDAATLDNDMWDLEQYISPEFLTLLQDDDLGLSPC